MSHYLVIFGASGDPTSRELMPALARIDEAGQLPTGFSVLSGPLTFAWSPVPPFR